MKTLLILLLLLTPWASAEELKGEADWRSFKVRLPIGGQRELPQYYFCELETDYQGNFDSVVHCRSVQKADKSKCCPPSVQTLPFGRAVDAPGTFRDVGVPGQYE